jgi:hypothetical protein
VAQLAFDLTYDGPRLHDGGAMPVTVVAPALEALDEIVREASLTAFPDREPATLTLRGSDEGSLVLQLVLEAGWDHFVDIFSSDATSALANLFQLVGGGYGLFALIRQLRGRRIAKVLDKGDAGTDVELVLDDGEIITVPVHVLAIYRNAAVRKRARAVVEPLELDGVNRMHIVHNSEITLSIGPEDLGSFDPPPTVAETVGDIVVEGVMVSIAAPSFTENKWRLNDGTSTFPAAMDDSLFRSDVEAGREAFRAGDTLRVDMRIIQSRGEDGVLSTERRVLRVTEHVQRPTQMRLHEPDDDNSAHAA